MFVMKLKLKKKEYVRLEQSFKLFLILFKPVFNLHTPEVFL